MAAGFRANPHGICSSSSLMKHVALPDAINYDWIHSALQAGVFTHEVEALLAVTRIRRDDLQTFLANPNWSYPNRSSQKARQLHRVFDARRVSDEEPDWIRASCSELLGLYGMLRVFFALRCGAMLEFRGPLSSFDAACEVMDLFLLCKRGLVTISQGVPKLKAALSLHLRLHQETYGDAWITPKHHWLCDVPDQILRDGLVLDTGDRTDSPTSESNSRERAKHDCIRTLSLVWHCCDNFEEQSGEPQLCFVGSHCTVAGVCGLGGGQGIGLRSGDASRRDHS